MVTMVTYRIGKAYDKISEITHSVSQFTMYITDIEFNDDRKSAIP